MVTAHWWPLFFCLLCFFKLCVTATVLDFLWELKSWSWKVKYYSSQERLACFLGETDGQSRDLRVFSLSLHFWRFSPSAVSKLNLREFIWCRKTKIFPFISFSLSSTLTQPQSCQPSRKSPILSNSRRALWRTAKDMQLGRESLYSLLILMCRVSGQNLWCCHSKMMVINMKKSLILSIYTHTKESLGFYILK